MLDIQKNDYELTFSASGVGELMVDIGGDMFVDLDPLFLIYQGTYRQYFKKIFMEKALEEGVLLYSSNKHFNAYRKDLTDLVVLFKDFYSSNIEKGDISRVTVEKFFDFAVRLCKAYGKMNVEYTDKAYLLQNSHSHPDIKKNLDTLKIFKDEIRTFINLSYFEPDSYLRHLLAKLSQKFSVPFDSIKHYTRAENLSLFDGKKVPDSVLENRLVAFLTISINGKNEYFEGEEARKVCERFLEISDLSIQMVKGTVANKSKALIKGKVKIIPVDYSDFDRMNRAMEEMKQGDILVAETTAPELMLACKKAAAIITDLGGLMSHAAIVSREMGIPCIVGCKNATKILKDGDLIEVDAEKGIVRIVK